MSFNEYFSEYFSLNEYFLAIILHPPGDVKLIAILITKPTNLSHIQSELHSDT